MYRQASLDLEKFLLLLNRGTQEDISKLPGVGKKTLHQLLDLRTVKANATLKDVISSTCIGVGTLKKITGNEHVVKLVQFCQYFEETFKTIEKPSSVVSVDVGMSNIAMAHVNSSLEVLSWNYLQFNPPKPYSPGNLYSEVSHLLHSLPLSNNDHFIIEGQSHRTLAASPAAGFMDIGLRLRLIEAMLYGVASGNGLNVFCVSPKMVSKYFETNRNGQYYKKKQATISLTCHLVGAGGFDQIPTPMGNILKIPESFVEQYWKQKKMDDLSDCLLQAITFFEWKEMTRIW